MKHKTGRKLLSFLLTLAMVAGLMPGMSLTAQAGGEKAYAAYDVTTETNKTKSGNDLTALQLTFNERQWYIIEDNSSSATSGTVTLLSADTTFGTKQFNNNENSGKKYSTSQVKAYLDGMTGTGGAFADVAEAIETVNLTTNQYIIPDTPEVYETVNGVKLYLLSTEEASSLPVNVRKAEFNVSKNEYVPKSKEWWLRSPGSLDDISAAFVDGADGFVTAGGNYVGYAFGVRPALKLDLSKVTFDSATNIFTVNTVVEEPSTYALIIPATLDVKNAGWNATSGISAAGTLATGKKLTVTASSANSWALKSGNNSVGYNLAAATGTYSSSATPASWEFTELSSTATTKPMGIIVDDYSSKPAGTYQDTVTFTAKVESAVITVTWNNDDITSSDFYGTTFTKDGVTITAGTIDFRDKDFKNGGTFSTTLGNFTKIEVSSGNCSASGTGWSGSTWTGNASSVSFSGDIKGMGFGNTKFVFTIEPTN